MATPEPATPNTATTDVPLSLTARRHAPAERSHPRSVGWLGVSALAMGGSNLGLIVVGEVFAAQGSAAIPLLAAGLLLSWAATPGWIELVLMWPNRVGGIAATCAEAFRPYSPVLASLTGVCYWWGWVTRLALPIACVSALLALLGAVVPAAPGLVDSHRAVSFHLNSPFGGWFGSVTSALPTRPT